MGEPGPDRICRSCSPVDAKKCDECGTLCCAHFRLDQGRERGILCRTEASTSCINCVAAEDPGPKWSKPWLAARVAERDDDGLDTEEETNAGEESELADG